MFLIGGGKDVVRVGILAVLLVLLLFAINYSFNLILIYVMAISHIQCKVVLPSQKYHDS